MGTARIILPAFSLNAAGVNVLEVGLPADWQASDLRCFASTGDELLDFGAPRRTPTAKGLTGPDSRGERLGARTPDIDAAAYQTKNLKD